MEEGIRSQTLAILRKSKNQRQWIFSTGADYSSITDNPAYKEEKGNR
jgi:hypothetical protein